MRFIDEVKIRVAGGHGGPGCVSFRRETFVPRGGPDGGEGGAGGSVIFQACAQLSTLQDLRLKRSYCAKNGLHGSGANKTGQAGADIVIRVPVGTWIRDEETLEPLVDLVEDQQTWVACKGGRGGKGNAHFVTSTHQAPKFAQPGEEGEQRVIRLELKLLADVGIMGFPNAGKSTLISAISAARPKIASYPFTTLRPQLGVVSFPDHSSFVIADIPGLIEGAHRGEGLGHRFLKHLERTRLFIHLLDGASLLETATAPGSPSVEKVVAHWVENYRIIRRELELFQPALLEKPEWVVVNKSDLFDQHPALAQEIRSALREKIQSLRKGHLSLEEPWFISAASHIGLEPLLDAIRTHLNALKRKQDLLTPLPDDEGIRR